MSPRNPLASFRTGSALAALAVCLTLPAVGADEVDLLAGARFSSARAGGPFPTGWAPLTFRRIARATQYSLVDDAGTVVVRADADRSASGMVYRIEVPSGRHVVLRWRWRIEAPVVGSDPARKSGDDYPARIYVTFGKPADQLGMLERALRSMYGSDLPHSGINYLWATDAPVGSVVPNAYTGRLRMVVVESGAARAGRWVEEERDPIADYRRAFGTEPPPISGIAIMTDTDDTGGRARAYYGDIALRIAPVQ